LIKRDKKRIIHFASLQGDTAAKMLTPFEIKSLETVILKSGDQSYSKSTASLRSIALLGGQYKMVLIFLIVPPFIRNWVYKIIANNRLKWFGKREACRIPNEKEQENILP